MRLVWSKRGLAVPDTPCALLSFEGIEPLVVQAASGIRSLTSPKQRVHWAYSSVGLEHTPDKREVGSSSLPRPTTQVEPSRGAVAQLGERRLCKP